MFPPLDLLLKYWIEHVTIGPFYVKFIFAIKIFYGEILGFATDDPFRVSCRGLTTLHSSSVCWSTFWNLISNKNSFVSLI